MESSCNEYRDLLVAESLGELDPIQRDLLDPHLDSCPACQEVLGTLKADDRDLTSLVSFTEGTLSRLEETIMVQVASTQPAPAPQERPRNGFLSSGWVRWGAAAVLILCVLLGTDLLNGPEGGGIVWAEIMTQVEKAESYICRRTEKRKGEPALDMVEYRSARYGLRQDIYEKGKHQATQYIVPAEKMLYALIHRDRTYMRQKLSDEVVAQMRLNSNAREIVKSFREQDYRSLGRKKIDGKMAEGIEITEPSEWVALYEDGNWRLWIDIETQWPVLIELEGIALKGKVRKSYRLENFQWNAKLSAVDFAPEIPGDYKLIADLDPVEANEEQTIASLRAYAQLVGGRYPSQLSLATAIAEAEQVLDQKHGSYDEATGKDLEVLFTIRGACEFHRDLAESGLDVAYNGEQVTPLDFDRVLMRWRLDNGEYRIIYGDLRTETVSEERMGEIEGQN